MHRIDETKPFRSHRVDSSICVSTLVIVVAHRGQVHFCCTPTPEPVYLFLGKDIPKKKTIENISKLRNVWKTQTRLEQGLVVAIDTCTEFRIIFRRYVIVIWKESPSSKRRALHKGKLVLLCGYVSLFGDCFDMLRVKSTTKPAIARQPAEIRQPHP